MVNISGNALGLEKSDRIYAMLLLLYPEPYRKKFDSEMLYTFQDMVAEERANHGWVGVGFWSTIIIDTLRSALHAHREVIRKEGMKKYFRETLNLNNYNLVSLILLLPFLVMGGLDFIGRLAQGDLSHINNALYAALSGSPLYWPPVLFAWVVLFPILAVVISLIPLAINRGKSSLPGVVYLRQNMGGVILITVGILLLAAFKLHDFLPCMVNNISVQGFGKLPTIISLCRKA